MEWKEGGVGRLEETDIVCPREGRGALGKEKGPGEERHFRHGLQTERQNPVERAKEIGRDREML